MSRSTDLAAARSFLFVPATRSDRFAKARAAGADAVILDLEDAVPPERKEEGRAAATRWLDQHQAVVRVNGPGTPWHEEDVRQVAGRPGIQALIVPKAETPADLSGGREAGVPVIPLVESAAGVIGASSLARAPGVARLMFGNLDFSVDVGVFENTGPGDGLLLARSTLVLASAAARLPGPVDGVHPSIDDRAGLRSAAAHARSLGMSAKLCVHPSQVPIVNEAFTPAAELVAWAERVIAAEREAARGVVLVDGEMLDKPQFDRARRILACAGRRSSGPPPRGETP